MTDDSYRKLLEKLQSQFAPFAALEEANPELGAGQRYVVYWVDGSTQVALGEVRAANLGGNYRLQVVPGQSVDQAGRFSWLVVLEDGSSEAIIDRSETRPITLLIEN